jgi:hypothetical protein
MTVVLITLSGEHDATVYLCCRRRIALQGRQNRSSAKSAAPKGTEEEVPFSICGRSLATKGIRCAQHGQASELKEELCRLRLSE